MDIELLLAHCHDHRPVLEDGLSLQSAGLAPAPTQRAQPAHLRYDSGDPDDLSLQRWGLIAPRGPAGDRLLALVEPLRRQRERAQGAPARVYRVPARMSTREAARWKSTIYRDEGVPEEELPRYLLILGDLDQVDLTLQQVLASDAFVGRLALPDEDGYEAYVAKVLRWEQHSAAAARALFCTVRDGTPATRIGDQALMAPSVSTCRARRDNGLVSVSDIVELGRDGPALDELLAAVARPEPSFLFSISHGLGAPRGGWRSVDEQRALQGAMGFGPNERLAAEDIAGRRFLPGGMWFYLACYGGATPAESAYYAWLKRLHEAGVFPRRAESVLAGLPRGDQRPFVAALPQAVLANPEGALAVVAHADLAWTYSFRDIRMRRGRPFVRNRPSRFQAIFRSILDGSRAGAAYHELMRYLGETSVELSLLYDEEARREGKGAEDHARAVAKAELFLLRNDLAGYILLGDPAVRLPLAQQRASAGADEHTDEALAARVASVLGIAPAAASSLAAPAALQGPTGRAERDVDTLEQAVLAVLCGEGERAVAASAGITRAELSRWIEVYRAAGRAALERLAP